MVLVLVAVCDFFFKTRLKYRVPSDYADLVESQKLWIGTYKEGKGRTVMSEVKRERERAMGAREEIPIERDAERERRRGEHEREITRTVIINSLESKTMINK